MELDSPLIDSTHNITSEGDYFHDEIDLRIIELSRLMNSNTDIDELYIK
jgi:hypothetical protein